MFKKRVKLVLGYWHPQFVTTVQDKDDGMHVPAHTTGCSKPMGITKYPLLVIMFPQIAISALSRHIKGGEADTAMR